MLSTCDASELIGHFDVLFLDLDGVVYRSGHAVEHAVESLNLASAQGIELRFLTNNASRTPAQVAAILCDFGLDVDERSVITSAMAIAQVMASELPAGSSVYVVGHEGLEVALTEVGLQPTRDVAADVSAVVQGHSPETNWRNLADAGHLIASGLPWYASNTDATIPTDSGQAPGNGAFVRLLQELTGKTPQVAGKPFAPLFTAAQASVSGQALMIGDRLDTDIEGANSQAIASTWVNTGVHGVNDLIAARPELRPGYVIGNLSGLFRPQHAVHIEGTTASCGAAVATSVDGRIEIRHTSENPEDELRAIISLGWHLRDVAGEQGERNATLDL